MTALSPAFSHLIDEGIANRVKAQKHLAAMTQARRDQLDAEWLEAEAAVHSCREPVSEDIRQRAAEEWSALSLSTPDEGGR